MVKKKSGHKLFDFAFSKKEAESEARQLRRKGSSVKIKKAGEGYKIYKKPK